LVKIFRCARCGAVIERPPGSPKPSQCPECGAPSVYLHRVNPGPPRGSWAGYARIGRGMGRGGPKGPRG